MSQISQSIFLKKLQKLDINCLFLLSGESEERDDDVKDSKDGIKLEKEGSPTIADKKDSPCGANTSPGGSCICKDGKIKEAKIADCEIVRDLRAQLK